MTDITDGQLAALDYIESLPGRPQTVFPNRSAEGKVPRWEVLEGPVVQSVALLNGDTQAALLLQIDVVVAGDGGRTNLGGTNTMRKQVKKVLNAFPVRLEFGDAIVLQPPSVSGYRKDGNEYRASITVPYRML